MTTKENFLSTAEITGTDFPQFIDEWFDDNNYIIAHTSGSTGSPKEIRLPKAMMEASARATNAFLGIGEKSLLVSPLSAKYIAGKIMAVRAIVAGAKLIAVRPANELHIPDSTDIDLLPAVPSQVPSLLKSGILPKVKNLLIGGAPLPPDLEHKLLEYESNESIQDNERLESNKSIESNGVKTWISFGMTETCSHVALRRAGEADYHALPGINFSTDDRGCLVINWVALDKPLITNDIIELTDSTTFRWLGRADNVINSGGIKLFPEIIEQKLAEGMPPQLKYYITRMPHPKWGEAPLLVVEEMGYDPKILLSLARCILTAAERPADIKVVEKFEYTSSGKLIRKAY